MTEHPNLAVSDVGAVRVLRIDRQEKLGALNTGLVRALDHQVGRVAASSDVRTVVLAGTGRGFIAGADIEEYATASAAEFEEYQRYCREVFESLAALPQVTIAAVNGYAFGGGFELALCCDIILASPDARFGLPEIKLGLVPGGGGINRLADAVSGRWAKELMISGRTLDAAEALQRGIITEIVRDGSVLDRAIQLGAELAQRAPLAVRQLKLLMAETDTDAAARERDALVELFASADGKEGISAFAQKREPRFDGR